ncbi:MAG: thiamine-phosphate kinase [Deltaproteobacteria bacterium]|nr:thiamine-phosphate kinase [Deltaproteobacteria bacterium]
MAKKKPPAQKPPQSRKKAAGRAAKPLSSVGEFGLIDLIARTSACERPDVVRAIGDDAAVLSAGTRTCLLATVDVLNESVHFSLDSTSPYLLGRKSLAVNISDIAAMGARPLYCLVGLSLPKHMSLDFVRELYRGIQAQAKRFKVALVGGDTVAARGVLSIAVTLIGRAEKRRIVYRSGARPGDLVFVSGTLGDSALGLALLQQGSPVSSRNHLIRRHCDPEPRVALGQALAHACLATSMIDISDGLAADLGHILEQSRVGAELQLEHLPLSKAYQRQCPSLCDDFYAPAVCGGEDYELLFTAAPRRRKAVAECSRTAGVAVTCIGRITGPGGKLRIFDSTGREYTPVKKGFCHF